MFSHPGRIFATACLALGVLGGGAAAHAQAPSGKLVLYTSQPERDAAQTVAGFKRVNPGVEVEVFRSGTTEVMAKLAAEFSAGQSKADVLLLADAASMEALKKDGRLLAYPRGESRRLRRRIVRRRQTYFGSKLITTGIAVNTSAKIRPHRGPTSRRTSTRARSPCRARSTRAPRRSCSAR